MRLFADIILPLPLNRLFTYYVPEDLRTNIRVGSRIIVPFGKSKFYTGIVFKLHNNDPNVDLKNIESLLDESPLVSDIQLQLWQWVSSYYLCSLGEVFKAALPAGLKLESETEIELKSTTLIQDKTTKQEFELINALTEGKSYSLSQISKLLQINNPYSIIKRLMSKGYIEIHQNIRSEYKEKIERFIGLGDNFINESQVERYPQQFKVLKSLLILLDGNLNDCVLQSRLLDHANASSSIIKSLEKKQLVKIFSQQVDRITYNKNPIQEAYKLNAQQENALRSIKNIFQEKNVCLLHGVTSSGKTEVYIHLIQAALNRGKQVLFLVPEIALTPQMTSRLQRVFGDNMCVYHSKFSDAERVEIWTKQANVNKCSQLVLGVRSSVFLPFYNLDLIIVDEEHESSYKQYDPNPRYNARDFAIVMAQKFQAKVLLGTATPSIETYYNTSLGKYGIVEMLERHKQVSMPEIVAVDMSFIYHKKEYISNFSAPLLSEIEKALDNKQQVIIFQNRRGYSSFVECKKCGYIPKCKYCDVSLNYYKFTQRLSCHYCGYSLPSRHICPHCREGNFMTKGFGTEKIEHELGLLFKEARIQRMDLNNTRSKNAYENIIRKFEQHKLDILVGTQMVSKGLDFAGVHVVGIMNADNMLHFPDFRAHEQAFQLMAQVSGRAGRSSKKGLVILQTKNPNHPIIKQVINNDYQSMYKTQLAERKLFRYPPFFRLIKISFQHSENYITNEAMNKYALEMKLILGNERILGPEWPIVKRVKNRYIKSLIIKIENGASLQYVKKHILEGINNIQLEKKWSSIRVIIDVDPISL